MAKFKYGEQGKTFGDPKYPKHVQKYLRSKGRSPSYVPEKDRPSASDTSEEFEDPRTPEGTTDYGGTVRYALEPKPLFTLIGSPIISPILLRGFNEE